MKHLTNQSLLRLGIFFILLAAGCTPAPRPATVPSTPAELPASPTPLPATPMPAPTLPPTDQPLVSSMDASLSRGLWLVLRTGQGVEALQRETGERVALLENLAPDQPVALFAPQKSGGWFALLDGQNLTLNLYQAPDRRAKKQISLLSASGLDEEKRAAYRQALLSLDPPAVAWSPDGENLAFLAAIERTTLDLYVLDINAPDLPVLGLSEGEGDSYRPAWSPDGAWIVYDQIEGLNTVGLWAVTAVRAARPNGSETNLLYQPESYAEPILGWSSPGSFIVHSVRDRGPVDLREVVLDGGEARPIFSGVFHAPVYDSTDGLSAFLVTDSFTDQTAQPEGLYAGSMNRPPRLLAPGPWSDVTWSGTAKLFFALNQQATAFTTDGKSIAFKAETSLPAVSFAGDRLAFFGGADSARPGLRLYDVTGSLLNEVVREAVDSAAWLPDGALVYRSGGNLYLLPSVVEKPTLLANTASLLGWLDVRSGQ